MVLRITFSTVFSTARRSMMDKSAQNKGPQRLTLRASVGCGEGGIRTLDPLAGTPVFETGTINHSATSPGWLLGEPLGSGCLRSLRFQLYQHFRRNRGGLSHPGATVKWCHIRTVIDKSSRGHFADVSLFRMTKGLGANSLWLVIASKRPATFPPILRTIFGGSARLASCRTALRPRADVKIAQERTRTSMGFYSR